MPIDPAILSALAAKHGTSEEEALAFVHDEIVRVAKLFSGLGWGPHEGSDIRQQAALFALTVLQAPSKYDPSRELEPFLRRAVGNKLKNFKRDGHFRMRPQCKCCDPDRPPENPCRVYRSWRRVNASKACLARSFEMKSHPPDPRTADPLDAMIAREGREEVRGGLPESARPLLDRATDGERLSEAERRSLSLALEEHFFPPAPLPTDVLTSPERKGRRWTCRGLTLTLPEWSEVVGVPLRKIQNRVRRGWAIDEVLFLKGDMRSFPR